MNDPAPLLRHLNIVLIEQPFRNDVGTEIHSGKMCSAESFAALAANRLVFIIVRPADVS